MSVTLLIGDCRERLKELPDGSVHCCVTSPPYFGLRDYGTAAWDGGDPSCNHEPPQEWIDHNFNANGVLGEGHKGQSAGARGRWYNKDGSCKCGATRIDRQMGLEPTPDEFVAGMVKVFREVRRVLRDDGTLWLNIGDSYSGSGRGAWNISDEEKDAKGVKEVYRPKTRVGGTGIGNTAKIAATTRGAGDDRNYGCKPKDLIGIPWMLAFALRADGWYLRQEIIWHKPNPMPESVRDRCTKAHEQIFLLSKSPRYYFDAEAIAEQSIWADDPRNGLGRLTYDGKRQGDAGTGNEAFVTIAETRNKRSVWTVATQPYSEAHFATYPPALIEPCILAGCPAKCCAKCGAPVVRRSEVVGSRDVEVYTGQARKDYAAANAQNPSDTKRRILESMSQVRESRFEPSCSCDAGTVAGTVLDPFGGAGTTGMVADRLGRNAILVELNPEYAALAERRLNADAGMFAEVKAA